MFLLLLCLVRFLAAASFIIIKPNERNTSDEIQTATKNYFAMVMYTMYGLSCRILTWYYVACANTIHIVNVLAR